MSSKSTIYVGKKHGELANELALLIGQETGRATNVPKATRIAIEEALEKRNLIERKVV